MTLAATDYDAIALHHRARTHEHRLLLGALGARVPRPERASSTSFRRSLDIAGHVSWVPGGTELSSGRLGVMLPVGTGLALGLKAHHGAGALVICHSGDAGWISGQALNGFNAAAVHRAPITFVMHRNGIQLSGTTRHIMNQDPRPIIESLGIRILEIRSLHDRTALFAAYQEAFGNAQNGQPTLIYPTGFGSSAQDLPVTVEDFGRMYGIADETRAFAAKNDVSMDRSIWIPGSLMSFRDVDRDAPVPVLRQRSARRRGASRRRHEGPRRRSRCSATACWRSTARRRRALEALRAQPPRDGRHGRASGARARRICTLDGGRREGRRAARPRQVGLAARRIRSRLRRRREEVREPDASSCRAISIRRRSSARPSRCCRRRIISR